MVVNRVKCNECGAEGTIESPKKSSSLSWLCPFCKAPFNKLKIIPKDGISFEKAKL